MNAKIDGHAAGTTRPAAPSGYRLPEETRLGRVTLQVADLERSLAYYTEVLGMRVLTRGDGRADLGAHGSDDVLVELHERPGAAPVPRHGRLGLYHFAILLPDRAALGRLLAHLSAIGVRAGASDHLVSEALYLHDPDGLGIEVYVDRPRSEWRFSQEQLMMDTLPLDFDGVIRAAGGEAWTGMPAGTVIGHVHLHVGDIGEATRFYHQGLGFDRTVWNYPGALFLSAGGYHHHLGVNTWARGAQPAGEGDARLLSWEIVLPGAAEVAAAAANLSAEGYSVELGEGHAAAADPWGTALHLVARPI